MAVLTPEQQQEYSRQRLGLQSESDLNRRRLTEDYDISNRILGQQNQQGQQNALDQLASQGLANSGIRINAQGQVQRDYNESLSNLNLQRTRGYEDISRNLSTGLAQIGFNEAQSLAQANRNEQADRERRAMLEAQSRAALVPPPAYPNPVIAAPAAPNYQDYQMQEVQRLSQGLGKYDNWFQFVKDNPQLHALYLNLNGGDMKKARAMAEYFGQVGPTSIPSIGHQVRR